MDLSEDDVLEILRLFERSKFDFLELQHGERRIAASKAGAIPALSVTPPVTAPMLAAPLPAAHIAQSSVQPAAPSAATAQVATGLPAEGLVAIAAPIVGKFYAAPSPADPPYVQVGARVDVGATVGLIEVMKVFNSVKAETAGVVERILVANGELVEFGQPLFLLRPDAVSKS
ncbi:MAG: acetyl-CoA carboxylase biotin carboxyl carrier protein [Hyphomicrobiales bacterium]|nr:acetyl-CoA carboxylase biotin carboxyl carrier protein [Hyphomicrobiales bacterium]